MELYFFNQIIQQSIVKKNGLVKQNFIFLLAYREGRVMGVLEVSRSIGDGPYKNHGVSCIPDVKRCQLTDNDR